MRTNLLSQLNKLNIYALPIIQQSFKKKCLIRVFNGIINTLICHDKNQYKNCINTPTIRN